jgi:hypothetical protein
MPEWIKVLSCSLALMVGASVPTIVLEWNHVLRAIRATASNQPYNNRDLEDSKGKERSTEPISPTVEKIASKSTADIENREEEKARQDRRLADYTELLFFATLLLGLATAGIVVVAYFQMRDARRSIDSSVKAASAAAASAKAADRNIALAFRPRLVVRRISLDKWEIGGLGEVQYVVANVGASAGTIVESNATIYILRQGALPPIPPYSDAFNSMGNSIIHPGPGVTLKEASSFLVTDQDYDRVFRVPRPALYLIGYIVYDGEGGRHHMAFGRKYDAASQRFVSAEDINYEYGE